MIQNNQTSYIISGSSRRFGDTRKVIDLVVKDNAHKIVDLNDLSISYYDYEHNNQNDDFIPLIKNMLNYQKMDLCYTCLLVCNECHHENFFR